MMGPGILMKDLKIFRDLGTFSQSRGTDGAGIYQVRSINNPNFPDANDFEQLYKSEETFSSLLNEIDDSKGKPDSGVEYLLRNTVVDVVMGHNRSATIGSITTDNAHPFSFRNIIGAHNGTLRDVKYKHATKTDSELMFEDINERGLGTVLTELDPRSAFAISLFNRHTRSMYFSRNNERPLGMALNKNRGVLYWASELDMLKYTLHRNGEDYKAFNINPFKVVKVYAGDITVEAITNNPADILTVTENFVQKPSVEVQNNVVPFVKQEVSSKVFHANCVCGKKKLNLIDIKFAQSGKHRDYRFVKLNDTDQYYCNGCDPVGSVS